MSIESKINIIVSIITCSTTIISLFIAVIALFQSNKQIKVSNKQNLFNERIKSYLIIKGLMQLYIDNKVTIEEDKKDGIYFVSDFVLGCLTNNSYLEIMGNVINKPIHQEEQKEFLRKIEGLKMLNLIELITINEDSIKLNDYKVLLQLQEMRKLKQQCASR